MGNPAILFPVFFGGSGHATVSVNAQIVLVPGSNHVLVRNGCPVDLPPVFILEMCVFEVSLLWLETLDLGVNRSVVCSTKTSQKNYLSRSKVWSEIRVVCKIDNLRHNLVLKVDELLRDWFLVFRHYTFKIRIRIKQIPGSVYLLQSWFPVFLMLNDFSLNALLRLGASFWV